MKKNICYFCKEEIEGFGNPIGDLCSNEEQKVKNAMCCDKCYSTKAIRFKIKDSQFLEELKKEGIQI